MSIYNLMIVEDEDTIRQGLVHQVPWERFGFTVMAEARHGREALEMMEANLPDAVLTDIKMPVMNGIDLMAAIRQRHPGVKVVILSGYGEFEYAQKGIEYGAFAYILKPTKEKNIEEVFLRLKADMDEAAAGRTEAYARLQGLKSKFIEDILTGRAEREGSERILAGLLEAGVDVVGRFAVLKCRMASLPDPVAVIHAAIGQASGNTGCSLLYLHGESGGVTAALAISGSGDADGLCASLAQAVPQGAPLLGLGVGGPHPGVMNLGKCLEEATHALEQAFYAGRGAVVAYGAVASPEQGQQDSVAERQLIEKLADAVARGDATEAAGYAARFTALHKVMLTPLAQLAKRVSALMAQIEAKVAEKHNSQGLDRQVWQDRLAEAVGYGSIEEVAALIDGYVADAIQLLQPDRMPDGMARAVDFIHASFTRKVTLEEAAGIAFMNPSYFSRQFKQHTGKSFIDYLTSLRIEKARALLQDREAKVYEVSVQVGYEDYRHFCKVFRKATGMSPLGYKAARPDKR